MCTVERRSPMPVRRRLCLTRADLGKNIPDGTDQKSAMDKWSQEVFSATSCSIFDPSIVLQWCQTELDWTAISVLQEQIGVLI